MVSSFCSLSISRDVFDSMISSVSLFSSFLKNMRLDIPYNFHFNINTKYILQLYRLCAYNIHYRTTEELIRIQTISCILFEISYQNQMRIFYISKSIQRICYFLRDAGYTLRIYLLIFVAVTSIANAAYKADYVLIHLLINI